MPYNQKYFFEFDTLKTANKVTKYYRVVFSKLEDIAYTYDLIELQAANSPFVLTYRSPEDNAFSPIKTSSAEINILYPYDPATGTPEPDEFLNNTTDTLWLVQLYELTSNGAVSTLKWQGYLIDDVQYEWQDAYYYRLVATDNLAVLKDVKYSDDFEFKFPDYTPLDGISVKDFIIKMVNKTGNTLNYKFAWELYNNSNPITLDALYTSLYTLIDWKTFQPKNIYLVLEDILRTLGCIIYQDNNDATWTILNVAEIGTRTNNQVPYDLYDSDGVYISSGNISLNSSINTGATDLVWRDKNQIVSFLKPIGGYEVEIPYEPKNLLPNYSFQEDTGSHPGWFDIGTFSSNVGFGSDAFFGVGYDDYYLGIDSSESNISSLDVSNYFYGYINIDGTRLVNRSFRILFKFKTNLVLNSGATGEGFNFQLFQRTRGGNYIFYDTEEIIDNRTNGGQWVNNGIFYTGNYRTPVFADRQNPYKSITIFTRPAGIGNYTDGIQCRFLKYRYDSGVASSGEYKLDETFLALNPLQYRFLEKLKFIAYFNPRFSRIQRKSIFTGGFQNSDWYVLEGCLGVVDTDSTSLKTRYYTNALWDRHWEIHDESSINYLDSIVAKSIISFYRNISRKFTGNVWGEQISYPKYFEIEGAINKNAPVEVANAFDARVIADVGEVENILCGSNYLTEYYQLDAKFLMVEASFDYQQSTTNVNLHEDLTSTIETNFTAGFGGLQFGQGVLPGSYGSSEDSNAEPITPS